MLMAVGPFVPGMAQRRFRPGRQIERRCARQIFLAVVCLRVGAEFDRGRLPTERMDTDREP